jgi:methionyl-tRNA formyltransferase
MKVLLFCNDLQSAHIAFELIRLRHFAGIVVPVNNKPLIAEIRNSGYVQDCDLFTPDPKSDAELHQILDSVNPDLGLIATFPRILPKAIFTKPRLGFYNMHYGLLPKYRSANPIFWQIRNGEKVGGVSIIQVDATIDGGPVAMSEEFPIEPYDNYAVVLQKSVMVACQMVEPLMNGIVSGTLVPAHQDNADASYFGKPQLANVTIDWKNMPMSEIVATVNAGNPWNRGAITTFEGQEIRLIQVSPAQYNQELPNNPGEIILANVQHGVFVLCKNKELLRLDIIYTNLGYHSGGMMLSTGIQEGKSF